MAYEDFRKKLEDVESKQHTRIREYVSNLVSISRGDMQKNYSMWDENDDVFRSRKRIDKEDQNSIAKGQPAKMIVPLTYSQIMTFVAFSIMSVTQNRRFFELEPTGTEDNPLEEPMELIIERDLRKNQWTTFLVQFFLDIGRFGLGAGEICYKEEYRYMRIPQTQEAAGPFGTTTETTTNNYQQLPFFVGNKIYNISPYRFFPDTRLPLTRYQEGEFCGSEDMFSMSSLKSQGETLFNLDKVPKYTEDGYKKRREISRVDLGGFENRTNPNLGSAATKDSTHDDKNFVKSGPVVITKMVCDITPKDLKCEDEEKSSLGDENFPVRYIVWLANDKTVVRFEEAYFLHGMFPYFLGQYLPDQHIVQSEGLSNVCEQLTTLVTWKINAHIASQKNSVESKWIVDPAGVDMASLESRSPYIRLRRNASQTGIDRYIKQFKTEDVTAGVFNDVSAIEGLLEKVTGWSSQMQGQYSQGRRSATQDRVVAQGASARGKTMLGGIWDTAFEPCAKQLLTNNRQEMDFDTFVRVLGKRKWPNNPDVPPMPNPLTGMPEGVPFTDEEMFTIFQSDPVSLACAEDFFVFDGTLPSEKAFLAQSLQEILMQVMSNPVVAQVMGYGPDQLRALMDQVYLLRGVTPARMPAPTPVPVQGAAPPQIPGQPPQIAALPPPPVATSA